MGKHNNIPWEDVKDKLLSNPAVRAEYDAHTPLVFPAGEWTRCEDGLPEVDGVYWVWLWLDAHDEQPIVYWAKWRGDGGWWIDGMYEPWDATDQIIAYSLHHEPRPPEWE